MDASSALHITGFRPDKSARGSGRSSTRPRGFESGDSNLSKLTDVFATMHLTGPDVSLRPVMPIPLATKLCVFEAQNEYYSNRLTLLNEPFMYILCLSVSTGRAKEVICDQVSTRNNGVRVPAIFFDYPRHSGATDEGMKNGPSIFAYLVFGPGRTSTEGTTRRTKITAWRGPGAKLGVQGEGSKRPSSIRLRLGFISNRFYMYFPWRTIPRPNLRI
jgi:hypothetical protein